MHQRVGYIGGTEWGRASWVGKVYPAGAKSGDFLKLYARQFDTVELMSKLFYGLQPPVVIQRWWESIFILATLTVRDVSRRACSARCRRHWFRWSSAGHG